MSKVKKSPAVTRAKGVGTDFRILELDPQDKCGAGTSVQFLHRVIEKCENQVTNHLVFFDQHGWYCEHGRGCPAVGQVKRYLGWSGRD